MNTQLESKTGKVDQNLACRYFRLLPLQALRISIQRFCTTCAGIISNFALEKYKGQKCFRCNVEVEFIDKSDGYYRRCVRCSSMLRCTMKFCYNCGRDNVHYDEDKVSRLERQLRAQIKLELKNEAKLAESYSEALFSDGDFKAQKNSQSSTNEKVSKDGSTQDEVHDDEEGENTNKDSQ